MTGAIMALWVTNVQGLGHTAAAVRLCPEGSGIWRVVILCRDAGLSAIGGADLSADPPPAPAGRLTICDFFGATPT